MSTSNVTGEPNPAKADTERSIKASRYVNGANAGYTCYEYRGWEVLVRKATPHREPKVLLPAIPFGRDAEEFRADLEELLIGILEDQRQ